MVSEDEESCCVECGERAYSVAYCTGCDGGTLYVADELLTRPAILSMIIAILADALAQGLEGETGGGAEALSYRADSLAELVKMAYEAEPEKTLQLCRRQLEQWGISTELKED
jgi:hypothetical protein